MVGSIGRSTALLALCAAWSTGVLAQASATRTSSFAYNPDSGQLIQEVIEPNTSVLRHETNYALDAFGNHTQVTVSGVDILTRTSTTTYDTRGQFATILTNALGQSETWQHDARFGTPTGHTGLNGLTTTWEYDGIGRKTKEVRADGTQTTWAYLFCSGVNGGTQTCPAGATFLARVTPLAADGVTQNGPITTAYFDKLERSVVLDTQGFDASIVRVTQQYDNLGRVQQESRPFFLSGGTPQLTSYTYDVLARVVTRTRPDNSTSQYFYHGLVTSRTNSLNQTRTTTRNSQGRVEYVFDAMSKPTSYAHEPFGNLTNITDALGNVTTNTYDLRGRKVASNDPNIGVWTFVHNTADELVSQTDSKNQTSTFSYDKLNRMIQRVEPDMTASWIYDTAAHGVGKLASASITAGPAAGFQRSYSYDALSRPTHVATTIDATVYTMAATYDADSRLSSVTYPSGFAVNYAYTSLGYPRQLSNAAGGQIYWTANALDAELHVTQQTAGNGVVTNQIFAAATGRLTSILAGSNNSVQDLSFTYDTKGNLLSRSDYNTSVSESFTYDALNRLTSATVSLSPTPLVKTFTYNEIGNLLTKSDVGTYSYPPPGSPRPHAVTSISGGTISTTFTYDPVGNQTAGLGRNIAYTSYNKPSSITQGSLTISFLHDDEEERFKQVGPEGTTRYVEAFGVLAELFSSSTMSQWNEYLSIGGSMIGVRFARSDQTVATRYFHKDHLGSVAVITNEIGVVVERNGYDAWGKRRFPNGTDDPSGSITSSTTRGYTNQEELASVSLVHMNARVYDPKLGKFTSVDPVIKNLLNGQHLNGYSYVSNNPLKFTDPSGAESESPDGGAAGGEAGGETGSIGADNDTTSDTTSVIGFHVNSDLDTRSPAQPAQAMSSPPPAVPDGSLRGAPPSPIEGPETTSPGAKGSPSPSPSSSPSPSPSSQPSPSPSPGPDPSPPSLKGANSTNAGLHANGLLRSVLGAGSFAPGPLGSLFSAMDAARALSQGDHAGAVASIIGAGVGMVGGNAGLTKMGIAAAVGLGAARAKGGLYSLRTAEGQVARTGRTGNLGNREKAHARTYPGLEFRTEARTDSYAVQRGLEQMMHQQYSPPLNKISPISPRNPNLNSYMRAARNFLSRNSDK